MPDPIGTAIIAHLVARDIPGPPGPTTSARPHHRPMPRVRPPHLATDVALPEPDEPNIRCLVRYLRNRDHKCKCGYNMLLTTVLLSIL